MLPPVLQQFIHVYETLQKGQWERLADIYAPDIHFQDPLHQIQGLEALQNYFAQLYTHLRSCHFVIKDVCHQEQQAFITWNMTFIHPRLQGGKEITVEGASHLRFEEKITFHRDYTDLGQMLYEHIPVLGSVIQLLKRRAVA
ncbi:MAG: nuclear transport factor 2 family protein [Thiofilum sp.]|uniref:nuclear transport factor 2 family protein n=1 Tax=Thiofilum sp. TaxID=2212733 RepID=UPI0025CF06CB|nr:nuclear transport factor 2 family protein [Thiofilum sp.]MBK8455381.1 nuclear transport factor 2 family protein [Thiofilum sp.]